MTPFWCSSFCLFLLFVLLVVSVVRPSVVHPLGKYNQGIPKASRFTLEQYNYIKERYVHTQSAPLYCRTRIRCHTKWKGVNQVGV